jgi:hypothetical protein
VNVGDDAGRLAGPHGEEEYAPHSASVVCERDCWIHFGFGGESELSTVVAGDVEAAHAADKAKQDSYTLDHFDLLAQERMAHWAILVAILTGAGVVLLYETLRETAVATGATRTAADAATAQAQASVNAGRAFLTPLEPILSPIAGRQKPSDGLSKAFEFNCRVHNRGLGPAFFWRFAVGHEVIMLGRQPSEDNLKVSDYLGRITISPDGHWGMDKVALQIIRLTDKEVSNIENGRGSFELHVFGYFEYGDLFQKVRQTGFHYSYAPASGVMVIERHPNLWFDRTVDPKKTEYR